MKTWPVAILAPLGAVALAAVLLISLFYGPTQIPLDAIVRALLHPDTRVTAIIVWDIRLPRVLAAALAGGALAVAGALIQALLQNPLADPYIIGASSGAGLGALLGQELAPALNLMAPGALVGALASFFLAWSFARTRGRVHMLTLILAGYALSVMLAAVSTFLMLFHQDSLTTIFAWESGGIHGMTWGRLEVAATLTGLALLLVLPFTPELNAFLLGEGQARHLGVPVERLEFVLLLAASLMTAAAVYLGGLIGFVGLIIPHIIRRLSGPDHRRLLPLTFCTGAAFLVIAGTLAENLPGIGSVPVGLVTAFLGGPYFLYLLTHYRGVSPV